LYWFSGGPDFGARYWYLILLPCVGLSVRGAQHLAKLCRSVGAPEAVKARVALGVLVLCAVAGVDFIPWRSVDKYYQYLGMRPEIRELAKRHDFTNSLVLIRGQSFPDYASAAVYNSVDIRHGSTLYVWERSREVRARVLEAFPTRKVWVVAGPSVTGNGYRVITGPERMQRNVASVRRTSHLAVQGSKLPSPAEPNR
jgi:hypothetical protein